MSDIKVPAPAWRKLKKKANCFAPALVHVAAAGDAGFSNAELYRAGQAAGISGLSQHIIGKAMDLQAVTHDTLQRIMVAYAHLREFGEAERPELADDAIVSALLEIPGLKAMIGMAGLTNAELSATSLVSERAIDYACGGNRVTGGIVCALHAALGQALASVPALEAFATSDSKAEKSVIGQPFTYEDLLLPLPKGIPTPWA